MRGREYWTLKIIRLEDRGNLTVLACPAGYCRLNPTMMYLEWNHTASFPLGPGKVEGNFTSRIANMEIGLKSMTRVLLQGCRSRLWRLHPCNMAWDRLGGKLTRDQSTQEADGLRSALEQSAVLRYQWDQLLRYLLEASCQNSLRDLASPMREVTACKVHCTTIKR